MNIKFFLTATILSCLVGCGDLTNNDLPTASQANQTTADALTKQQAEADEKLKSQKRICERQHIGNIKNRIKKASENGETGIPTYYCEKPFTRFARGSCRRSFSCETETHKFIVTLKDKGYTVTEVDETTHHVSWSEK